MGWQDITEQESSRYKQEQDKELDEQIELDRLDWDSDKDCAICEKPCVPSASVLINQHGKWICQKCLLLIIGG